MTSSCVTSAMENDRLQPKSIAILWIITLSKHLVTRNIEMIDADFLIQMIDAFNNKILRNKQL